MKRNILAVGALLVAVVLSSFTVQKFATVYFVYKTTNPSETLVSSYTYQTQTPNLNIAGSDVVAWFIGTASDPAAPTQSEFNTAFALIDGHYGGTSNSSLSDETNETTSNFEKRAE